MVRPHIHTPDDGRGPRQVLVDGSPVGRVVYADTRKGVVRVLDNPIRIHKRGHRAITTTLRGLVLEA